MNQQESLETTMDHKTIKRASAKIRRRGKCFVWIGAKNGHGYGVMRLRGRRIMARSVFADMFGVARRKPKKSTCEKSCVSCSLGIVEMAVKFGKPIQNNVDLRKFAIFYKSVLIARKYKADYEKCISFFGSSKFGQKISRSTFKAGSIEKVHLVLAELTPRKFMQKKHDRYEAKEYQCFHEESALDFGECTKQNNASYLATRKEKPRTQAMLDMFGEKREKGKGGKGERDRERLFKECRSSASDSRMKKMENLKQPKISTENRDSAVDCFSDKFSKSTLNTLAKSLAKSKGRKRTKYQYAMPHDWRPNQKQVDWFCGVRKAEIEAEITTGESDIQNLGGYISWLRKELVSQRDEALKVWNRLAFEESKRLGSVSPNISRELKVVHDGNRIDVSEAIYCECSKINDLATFTAELASAHNVNVKPSELASNAKSSLPKMLKDFPRLAKREVRSRIRQKIEAIAKGN